MSRKARAHMDGFLNALAAAGLPMVVGRRIDFFRAIKETELLSVDDLYWVARVMLVSNVDQMETFDAVFSIWFQNGGGIVEEESADSDESDVERPPETGSDQPPRLLETGEGSGREASIDELVAHRALPATSLEDRVLCKEISEVATKSLPRQRARRMVRSRHAGRLDMRRILGEVRRSGGDVVNLAYRQRPWRLRKVLMLVDVSGSSKATSPDALHAAHALMRVAPRMDVFTFGTRLTRITRALDQPDIDRALNDLGEIIFDFDGGTRIGPSFRALLNTARFQTLARGALIVVISDGLERGEVATMRNATEHLGRLAHRLVWLTPLMSDPAYEPATRGMQSILHAIDHLGSAGSLKALRDEIAAFDVRVERRPRRTVAATWQKRTRKGLVQKSENRFGRFQ